MINWNDKAKRLLKSELVKRGVSNSELVILLKEIGVEETKASVDSKISRGSFSACFLLQCLSVIGCTSIDGYHYDARIFTSSENNFPIAAEPHVEYLKTSSHEK